MGVTVETIRAGDGLLFPGPGQTVTVHYVGKTNGQVFDSTYLRNRPLKFKLGANQVIKGWDEGVSQLSLGEMATVKMTSDWAWGAKGIPGLVPGGKDERSGAAIEFEVELVGIQ